MLDKSRIRPTAFFLVPAFMAGLIFFVTVADASRTVRNSVRGAAIGAGVGALIDGGDGARTGAAAGAVAGAVARR